MTFSQKAISAGLTVAAGSPWAAESNKKYRVVIFLSPTCPCSRSYEEYLKKLSSSYNQEFEWVAVTAENSEDSFQYFSRSGFSFPVLWDKGSGWANELKALKTPHLFVLNLDRKEIVYRGAIADSHEYSRAKRFYLEDALESLSKNQPIQESQTRPLGCLIEH